MSRCFVSVFLVLLVGWPLAAQEPPGSVESPLPGVDTQAPDDEPLAEPNQAEPNQAEPNQAEPVHPLASLGWLVGRWVDKDDSGSIVTSVSWTKNQTFLTRSFQVTMDGVLALEGTQVIGWDPLLGRIRSWTFDSEGGFGEGTWIEDEGRWLVKSTYVTAAAEPASSVNVLTYVDDNTLRWKSIDREIGGKLMPNLAEVTVVRQDLEPAADTPADAEPDDGERDDETANDPPTNTPGQAESGAPGQAESNGDGPGSSDDNNAAESDKTE